MPGAASARRAPTRRAMRRPGCRRRGTFLGAQRLWSLAVFAIALESTGCKPKVTPPPDEGSAALQVVASSVPATVKTLVIELTAADIPAPRVFNVGVSGGTASGTITVPVGRSRTLTIRAYDGGGIESHRGATTVHVHPGVNPAVSISLGPLQGQQSIDVRVESLVITVTPGAVTLRVNQSARLQAAVKTAAGDLVDVAPTDIRWATLKPNVAAVGTGGDVLGVSAGSATIVAVYAGVGGSAAITVEPVLAFLGAGDPEKCAATLLGTGGQAGRLLESHHCYGLRWGRHTASTKPVPGNHAHHLDHKSLA
jgi:hypothetical protein